VGDPHGRPGGNRWDIDAFFENGVPTIDLVLARAAELGLPAGRARALDFGCGLGRLTQPLAAHFDEVHGVDIAESMIEGARRYNRHGARVTYHVNTRDDLCVFPDDSFDLILSYVTLQHIHPRYTLKYLLDFLRILKPGGLLAFQLPSREAPPPQLPSGAHRAAIRPATPVIAAPAGAKTVIPVTVRNASQFTWPLQIDGRDTVLRLGNHWLDERFEMLAFDDGRAGLPVDLAPGASVEIELGVTVPGAPGTYALELDLVHEGNCWFAQHGSPTARVTVVAEDAAADGSTSAGDGAEPFVPVMEVHGIPEPVVTGVLEACGAAVVAREPDRGAFAWEGWLYFVTK